MQVKQFVILPVSCSWVTNIENSSAYSLEAVITQLVVLFPFNWKSNVITLHRHTVTIVTREHVC